jgi:hypothetical protein
VTGAAVEITNLRAFQRDLRAALGRAPTELTAAIRAAGKPVLARAEQLAPVGTASYDPHRGALKAGYRVRAAGNVGKLVNRAPYSAGAEWGLHGKWSGFTKYAAFGTGASKGRGRFAWRAVVEKQDEIVRLIYEGIRGLVTIQGWAR